MIYVCIPYTADRKQRLAKVIESLRVSTSIPYTLVTYENDYEGWPKAVHHMLDGINDDAFVFLISTDSIVHAGCLERLVERHVSEFGSGYGLVEPFNELHHLQMAQHPFGQAAMFRKYVHTGYIHCFADTEMSERAIADGKLVFEPEAKIEHQHYVNGKAEMDKGYEFSLNTENMNIDRDLFTKRKQNGWK